MRGKRGDDGGAGGGASSGGAEKDSITVEFLDAFNGQKKAIEKCIDAISLATKQTISLSDQTKSAINPDDIDKISKQLADVVKNAQRDAAKGERAPRHARLSFPRSLRPPVTQRPLAPRSFPARTRFRLCDPQASSCWTRSSATATS